MTSKDAKIRADLFLVDTACGILGIISLVMGITNSDLRATIIGAGILIMAIVFSIFWPKYIRNSKE